MHLRSGPPLRDITNERKEVVMVSPGKKAVLLYGRHRGDTFQELADYTHCSVSALRYNMKKLEDGADVKEPTHRAGHPRVITPEQLAEAVRQVDAGELMDGAQVKQLVLPQAGASTVRRALREAGLGGYMARKKPLLLPGKAQERFEWATEWGDMNAEDWRDMVFSDESAISVWGSYGRKWVRRRPGEALKKGKVIPSVKHPQRVMVYGCISWYGPGYLHRIHGNFNSVKYINTVDDAYLKSLVKWWKPTTDFIYQHDNDAKSKSPPVMKWLDDHKIFLMDWPGYSADLNIIEHCWTYVKRKLRQNHPFASTPDKIWDAVQKEWAVIPLSFIRTLYMSMEHRVEAVHKAKGWQTPY